MDDEMNNQLVRKCREEKVENKMGDHYKR